MKCGKGLPKQDEDLNLKEATIRLNALKACPAEGDPPHEYIGRPKHVRIKNPHWNFKFNVGEVPTSLDTVKHSEAVDSARPTTVLPS